MSLLTLIVVVVLAMCLFGTVIWWFDKKVEIPGPFAWAKGLLSWVMVVAACWLIWSLILEPALKHGGHLQLP